MQHKHKAEGQVIRKGKAVYTEIVIKATPEKIWSVLTDFGSYPSWNPFIHSLTGNPIKGKKITAFLQPPHSKGMTFTPIVLQYEAQREFRWLGSLGMPYLFDGEHTFKIVDNHNGTCTFVQYERFRGVLVPMFGKMIDENTVAGFQLMNEAVKMRAEKL